MPTTFISQLVAFGVAALSAFGIDVGPAPTELAFAGSAPEVVAIDEEAAAASRIDPALLNNATLRRALAAVGPELVADPEVRAAIESGRFDASLMNNPTVSRAMMRVGPSLLADPELSAAVRSGALGPEMLSDPAVLSILRGLDPALRPASAVAVTSSPATAPSIPVSAVAVAEARGVHVPHLART